MMAATSAAPTAAPMPGGTLPGAMPVAGMAAGYATVQGSAYAPANAYAGHCAYAVHPSAWTAAAPVPAASVPPVAHAWPSAEVAHPESAGRGGRRRTAGHARAGGAHDAFDTARSLLGPVLASAAAFARRSAPVAGVAGRGGMGVLRSLGEVGGLAARGAAGLVRRDPAGLARTALPVLAAVLVLRAAFGQDAPHRAPWFDAEDGAAPFTVAQPVAGAAERADPVVFGLQSELSDLGYYTGAIDGIAGSRTRAAIEAFERGMGLAVTGRPGPELLARIRAGASAVATRTARVGTGAASPALSPAPLPLPSPSRQADPISTGSVTSGPTMEAASPIEDDDDDPVTLAQRGLLAAGESIVVDGLIGPATRAAIERYEAAHALPVTGEPEAVLAHMRAGGLL